MTSPTQLYRIYGVDGSLLYIGISRNWLHRAAQHAKDKPWFFSLSNMKVEQFETRQLALMAEAAAIKRERPKYNIVHNKQNEVAQIIRFPEQPKSPEVRGGEDILAFSKRICGMKDARPFNERGCID